MAVGELPQEKYEMYLNWLKRERYFHTQTDKLSFLWNGQNPLMNNTIYTEHRKETNI